MSFAGGADSIGRKLQLTKAMKSCSKTMTSQVGLNWIQFFPSLNFGVSDILKTQKKNSPKVLKTLAEAAWVKVP